MKAVPFKLNCFIQIKSENGKSERLGRRRKFFKSCISKWEWATDRTIFP